MVSESPSFARCRRVVRTLQRGQQAEAEGHLVEAVALYEGALAEFAWASDGDLEERRLHGVAWMNRANARQKLAGSAGAKLQAMHAALEDYDRAIAIFEHLPFGGNPEVRNHLGAAWLNRGHGLLTIESWLEAGLSFQRAISVLEPLGTSELSYVLNLAGAQVNWAHSLLSLAECTSAEETEALRGAAAAASAALRTVRQSQLADARLVEMELRARRALAMVHGRQLRFAEAAGEPTLALASEMADVIESGLVLARTLRPSAYGSVAGLVQRLSLLGANLYAAHQPHFLAEFILENVGSSSRAPFAGDPHLCAAALDIIEKTLAKVEGLFPVVAGQPETERRLDAVRSLRAARAQLSPAPIPAFT